jgi:hypothetical protein
LAITKHKISNLNKCLIEAQQLNQIQIQIQIKNIMKISSGWKIILYIFSLLGLTQMLELSYYLMNRPDSYLANLGLITLGTTIAAIVYCFGNLGKSGLNFIKNIEKSETKTEE